MMKNNGLDKYLSHYKQRKGLATHFPEWRGIFVIADIFEIVIVAILN